MANSKQPKRDESYWSALLGFVESLPVAQMEPAQQEENGYLLSTWSGERNDALDMSKAWEEAQDAFREERVITLHARGYNKGGLLVEWQELNGFIPASQLNDFPLLHLDYERMDELQRRQAQSLSVRVIEVDPMKNRLIFSERAATVNTDHRRDLWDEIRVGDRRSGVITNMANFGAFVDLGGVEGLIHISELSWSRLNHPSDVVRPGDRVTCIVLEVNRIRGRIALSRKQVRDDPWRNVADRYRPGQIVEGVVSDVVQYGAFITLEEELEGLVHISELAEGDFMHPRNVVDNGQWVRARVLAVDPRERRIALSMRGL